MVVRLSEILVAPPISVPGMMHVARYHNLRIVPIDIDFRRRKEDNTKPDQRNNIIKSDIARTSASAGMNANTKTSANASASREPLLQYYSGHKT